MSGDVSCRWYADWACVPSFGIPAKIHNRTRHRRATLGLHGTANITQCDVGG
jgi:hypothetical protein